MKKSFWLFSISILLLTACGKKTTETSPIKKDISQMLFASGTLEPDNKYNLMAQTDGYITSLNIEEGSEIAAGKVIGYIDNQSNITNATNANAQLNLSQLLASDASPALQQIAANISIAKQKLQQEQIQYDRYRKLSESNSISKLEFENAQLSYNTAKENVIALEKQYANSKKLAEQQLISQRTVSAVNTINKNYNELKATTGGKVYKKLKEVGDYVRKGDVIATIGNNNFLYAKLNVDESSIQKIKLGQQVLIQLNTEKNHIYKGEIFEILPAFDEATQSFICKAKFTEPISFTIAGTQLEANIIGDTLKNILVIPRNYLLDNNTVQLKNESEPKKIKTGFISTEWVQVLDGITEKDVLVTDKIIK